MFHLKLHNGISMLFLWVPEIHMICAMLASPNLDVWPAVAWAGAVNLCTIN